MKTGVWILIKVEAGAEGGAGTEALFISGPGAGAAAGAAAVVAAAEEAAAARSRPRQSVRKVKLSSSQIFFCLQ